MGASPSSAELHPWHARFAQTVESAPDLEFAHFIGYSVLPFEQVEYEVPTVMPEVLQYYILSHSPLSKPDAGRGTSRRK